MNDSSSSKGKFVECVFSGNRFLEADFANMAFVRCSFEGEVRGAFFSGAAGGGFFECDLAQAHFVDCAFRSMRFQDCHLGDEMLHFLDWRSTVDRFCEIVQDFEDAEKLLARCEAYQRLSKYTKEMLVDARDLVWALGPEDGPRAFGTFKAIAAEVGSSG